MTNLWTLVYRVGQFEYYSLYPWAYMRDELVLLELSLSRGFVTTAVKLFRNYLNEWKRVCIRQQKWSEVQVPWNCDPFLKWMCLRKSIRNLDIHKKIKKTSRKSTYVTSISKLLAQTLGWSVLSMSWHFDRTQEYSEGTKYEEFNFADYPVSATLP